MPLFERGHQKFGGRKRGTPNKRKLKTCAEVMAEQGFNPVVEILKILDADAKEKPGNRMSKGARIGVWLDLLAYCQAKPPVEVELDEDDDAISEKFGETTDEVLLRIVKSSDGAS